MNAAKFCLSLLAVGFAATATGESAVIYRCSTNGATTYSDRPCAADASVHESDGNRVTVYAAPPTSTRASTPSTGKKGGHRSKPNRKAGAARERSQTDRAAALRQKDCAKLYQALRDVRTKMRTGYGVAEGERLKARLRQLDERRRREKCR